MEDSLVKTETKKKYYQGTNVGYQDQCNGSMNVTETKWKREFTETRTGRSLPSWKWRIATGRNATTEYSRNGYDLVVKPGTYTIVNPSACGAPPKVLTQRWVGCRQAGLIPTSLTLPTISYGATQQARARFLASIKQAQQHISGPTFLGELKESLQMIRKPSKYLAKNIDDYIKACAGVGRRNRRKITSDMLNEDLHSLWLEYSIGWAPLISETKKGAEALSRLINEERKTFQVSGGARDETKNVSVINSAISTIAYAVQKTTNSSEAFIGLKGAVRPKASGPTWKAMNLFGFNTREFVPTVWELLPMSFVVDYFVNVGDILSATYTDITGLYWISEQRGMTYTRSMDESQIVMRPNQTTSCTGSGGSWTLKKYTYIRSKPVEIFPQLAVSLPGTPTQVLNLVALAASAKGASTKLSSLLN